MGLCPFRYRILRVLRLVKVIQPLYMLALGIAEATGWRRLVTGGRNDAKVQKHRLFFSWNMGSTWHPPSWQLWLFFLGGVKAVQSMFWVLLLTLVALYASGSHLGGYSQDGIFAKPCPGSPADQTKWLVFRMIHGSQGFPTTNGQSLVDLDFLGTFSPKTADEVWKESFQDLISYLAPRLS